MRPWKTVAVLVTLLTLIKANPVGNRTTIKKEEEEPLEDKTEEEDPGRQI